MIKKIVNGITGEITEVPLTAEEIAEREAYIRDVLPVEQMAALRRQRDQLLSDCDWVITMHKELGTNIPAAWKNYRQALRDLPANTEDPANPVWPTKPE
jgi:hypothetical protein